MADNKEIFEQEQARGTMELCRRAYLYSASGFLRAHEWSAWLFVKSGADLKITNRFQKNINTTLVMVGFPSKSLLKFTPDGCNIDNMIDGTAVVDFPPEIFSPDATPEALAAEYQQWKQSLPVDKTKTDRLREAKNFSESLPNKPRPTAQPESVTPTSGAVSMMTIVHQLMSYPVAERSPYECVEFVKGIQRQAMRLAYGI